jgi:amino acid transporter
MITARVILGQTGRVCMGVIVLAGSCSAVNVLLMAVARMLSGMAVQGLLPRFLAKNQSKAPIPLIIIALGIAALMASGMAGEPELEVYTRAGLWLWLLTYAVIHLALLIMKRRDSEKRQFPLFSGFQIIQIIGLVILLLSLFGLLWFHEKPLYLLRIILIYLGASWCLGILWFRLSSKEAREGSTGTDNR